MNVRNIIQLGYGIPCIACYFVVFFAMYGIQKVLSKSFVVVYVIMSITNIITWLNAWTFLRLSNEPFWFFYYEWLIQFPFMCELQTFLVSQFYYCQNIDALLVTFDRFAAVYGMMANMKWWTNHYVAISIVAHLLGIAIQAAIRLPMETLLVFDPVNQVYGLAFGPNDTHNDALSSQFQVGFGLVVTVACLVLNIFSYRSLRHLRSTKSKAIKIPFLLISTCILITQICNFGITTMFAIQDIGKLIPNENLALVFEIMYVTSDIFSLGPGVYTLLLPGPIRKFLVHKIRNIWKTINDPNQGSSNIII